MKLLLPLGLLTLLNCHLNAAESIDFEKQIRPLLHEHCVSCHGPAKQKSALRLDARSFAFQGGKSGPVIVPDKSKESELFRRVSSKESDERMPPGEKSLSSTQIELLKRWIEEGAKWEETPADLAAASDKRLKHWAWQPIPKISVPLTNDPASRNEIDHFIAEKLKQKGLAFSPEADRKTLIRRLSFDLLGVPPTPEEVRDFVANTDPLAYEKLLDRMLASPRYGERWARHWLDIAHYADTHGFERDQRRDHAYRYRDWVIQALNRDQPYDQFLRDQIAGDVLHPDDRNAVIATGFLAAGPWDFVGQAETPSPVLKRLARADDLDDMVTQVLTATCGVTINCARCHDHKLDPIPQKDYYRLWSVFAGVKRGNRSVSLMEEKRIAEKRTRLEGELRETRSKLAKLRGTGGSLSDVVGGGDDMGTKSEIDQLTKLQTTLEKDLASLVEPAKVYAVLSETPPEIKLLARGDTENPKDSVSPGSISCLSNLKADFGSNSLTDGERRIAFANWVTDPTNPLTRRVIVNRLWHHHFGTGLVETPSDFGLGGGMPSHPELLNWLAERLLQEKWSQKAMHRLICLSRTYRQVSLLREGEERRLDMSNRLCWRQNSRRVDAESLRDAVLSVSGKLNLSMYGPGYRDFDYKEEYAPVYTYITADRPELWRRSIYRFAVRTTPHQFLTTLDCPNPANLSPTRSVTTTALQSLALLNDDFMLKQAGYFAARVQNEVGDQREKQITRAFELAFGRAPSADEMKAAEPLVLKHGLAQLCRFLLNANEFVSVD